MGVIKRWNLAVPSFYYSLRGFQWVTVARSTKLPPPSGTPSINRGRVVVPCGIRLPQATKGWFNYREAMIELSRRAVLQLLRFLKRRCHVVTEEFKTEGVLLINISHSLTDTLSYRLYTISLNIGCAR